MEQDTQKELTIFMLPKWMYPEIETALRETIPEWNYRVRVLGKGQHDVRQASALLIVGALHYFQELMIQLSLTRREERPPLVLWHTEPLPIPGTSAKQLDSWQEAVRGLVWGQWTNDDSIMYHWLRLWLRCGVRPDLIVTSTRHGCRFLQEQGIPAHFAPLAYHPGCGRDLQLRRDIDVLWLGSTEGRRLRLLEQVENKLPASGVRVERIDFSNEVWGDERTRLLNRTKILLNIPRAPLQFPEYRFVLGAANKALIVTESVYDSSPFVAGKHFIAGPIEALPDLIAHYLKYEEERLAIVNEAYTFVTEEHTMRRSVSGLLELIESVSRNRSCVYARHER